MQPVKEPSKGRIVNYHCLDGERFLGPDEDMILAAIITRVEPLSLTVFTNQPSSILVRRENVKMGEGPGEWSWPVVIKDKPVLTEMTTKAAKVGNDG